MPFSGIAPRPEDADTGGLLPARFNERISGLFLIHNCPPAVER